MAIKHIGRLKSNKRKVAVAYRTIPGDANSALVVSTENLTDSDHDIMMQMVESPAGQSANELAEAMARTRLSDGSVMLARFHAQGKLTKVLTSDVIMTPDNNTTIALDELNKILRDMKAGEDATRKLAEADASMGLQDPADVRRRKEEALIGDKERAMPTMGTNVQSADGLLSDEALAADFTSQAQRMEAEAKSLLAESKRLIAEAKKLAPKPARVTKPKATTKRTTKKVAVK